MNNAYSKRSLFIALCLATILHVCLLLIPLNTPKHHSTTALIVTQLAFASGKEESHSLANTQNTTQTPTMNTDEGEQQKDTGQTTAHAIANAVSSSPTDEVEALALKQATQPINDVVMSTRSVKKNEKLAQKQKDNPLPINNTTSVEDNGAKPNLSGSAQDLATATVSPPTTTTYFDVANTWIEKNIIDLRDDDDFRSGAVMVEVTLQYGGVVTSAVIKKSSGIPLLDRAAKRSVLASSPFPSPPKHLFNRYVFTVDIFYDANR
jgi:TonB family protein